MGFIQAVPMGVLVPMAPAHFSDSSALVCLSREITSNGVGHHFQLGEPVRNLQTCQLTCIVSASKWYKLYYLLNTISNCMGNFT